MKSISLLRWHRRLGLSAATLFVLSGLSGLLHPFMTRQQPVPAKLELDPSAPKLVDAVEPWAFLSKSGVEAFSDLRVVGWQGSSYYQVTLPNPVERRYFHSTDGSELKHGDRQFAEFLAREYACELTAAVRSARLIHDFDWEYPRINRLLPVWRIEFQRADGLRVFVDTRTGRLGTLVDRIKAVSSMEFAILHRWQWLDLIAPWFVRLLVVAIFLVAALAVALSGLWLYIWRWRMVARRWDLRRLHRLWGAAISLASAMFVVSGGYHLLHLGIRGDAAERNPIAPSSFTIGQFSTSPQAALEKTGLKEIASLSVVEIDGQPYYRIQPIVAPSHHSESTAQPHGAHIPHGKATPGQVVAPADARFVSAADGSLLTDGPHRYARDVAARASRSPVTAGPTPVNNFDAEYGFAFKRLPVQRMGLANGTSLYIDPADGAVAAMVNGADRSEGWVFGNIHKLDWLVPLIGIDARDGVAVLLASLLAGVALLGVKLWLAQGNRQR